MSVSTNTYLKVLLQVVLMVCKILTVHFINIHQENVYCVPSDGPCRTVLPALQRSSTQMRWQAPASTGQTSQRLPEARILPYLEILKSYDMFFNYRQR